MVIPAQNDPANDNDSNYSENIKWKIVPATFSPDTFCTVEYTCTSITRVDGGSFSNLECSTLNADYTFDSDGGGLDDGVVELSLTG